MRISDWSSDVCSSDLRAWHAIYGELARAGIEVVGEGSMDTSAEAWLEKHFLNQVFPILTPQALDPAHPFPFIPNQGLSVVFDLVRLSDKEPVQELVLMQPTLSRWCRTTGKPTRNTAMEASLARSAGLRSEWKR